MRLDLVVANGQVARGERALEVGTVGQVDGVCQREGAGRDISIGLNHSQIGIARVVCE